MQRSRLVFRRLLSSFHVLIVCLKTAVAARRVALQMIQTQIVPGPDALRVQIRTGRFIGHVFGWLRTPPCSVGGALEQADIQPAGV